MNYRLDREWVRINDVADSDGNPAVPILALHVRTEGGMIVGRIIKAGTDSFTAQKYRQSFTDIGVFKSLDDAWRAIAATQP